MGNNRIEIPCGTIKINFGLQTHSNIRCVNKVNFRIGTKFDTIASGQCSNWEKGSFEVKAAIM